jgi:hypothetical protein
MRGAGKAAVFFSFDNDWEGCGCFGVEAGGTDEARGAAGVIWKDRGLAGFREGKTALV